MGLWDKLIEQCELTLNLLRRSHINPKLSAYAQLHGQFDFNATPLAPPGICILAHDKPNKRSSWAPHGEDGWYIGPAMDHYRCFRVYINKTKAERIVDTLDFFPARLTMPKHSSNDAIIKAAKDMIQALQEPHPATPFNVFGDKQLAALQQLANIFRHGTSEGGSTEQAVHQAPGKTKTYRPTTTRSRARAATHMSPQQHCTKSKQ
jgi:hypothetical protein